MGTTMIAPRAPQPSEEKKCRRTRSLTAATCRGAMAVAMTATTARKIVDHTQLRMAPVRQGRRKGSLTEPAVTLPEPPAHVDGLAQHPGPALDRHVSEHRHERGVSCDRPRSPT